MRNGHLLTLCFAIPFVALSAAPAAAQPSSYAAHFPPSIAERVPSDPTWSGRGVTVEGFYSRYQLDDRVALGRANVDGIGGRVLWSLAPLAGDGSSFADRLLSRTALGAFGVYAPEGSAGRATWHAGAEADHRLLPTPLLGRLDPIVSLGAGAFRTAMPAGAPEAGWAGYAASLSGRFLSSMTVPQIVPVDRIAVIRAPATRTVTSFALSPAFGLRLGVLPNAGLRADVRDVIAFRDGTTHNLELSGGLSLTF
jgi:hypothetical protein